MFNVHNSRKRKKYLTYKICASYCYLYGRNNIGTFKNVISKLLHKLIYWALYIQLTIKGSKYYGTHTEVWLMNIQYVLFFVTWHRRTMYFSQIYPTFQKTIILFLHILILCTTISWGGSWVTYGWYSLNIIIYSIFCLASILGP